MNPFKTLTSAISALPSFLRGMLVLGFLTLVGIGIYYGLNYAEKCNKDGRGVISCIVHALNPFPDSYGRGVGKPMTCADDEDYDAGLCYPRCEPGFKGVGPVCWPDCPPGFKDIGISCQKTSYGRGVGKPLTCADNEDYDAGLCYGKCPKGFGGVGPVCWKGLEARGRGVGKPIHTCPGGQEKDAGLCYPRCKVGYRGVGPVCWPVCPTGYRDDGAFCRKSEYGRGVGKPVHSCPEPQEQDAGLCYPPCQEGFKGVGPVCWEK